MTRQEFVKLIYDYGNACFDCGAWPEPCDQGMKETYEVVCARQQAARNALVEACTAIAKADGKPMTDLEKADLCDQLFQQLQVLRFGLERIAQEFDKPAFVNERIATAQKMLRQFDDDLRTLLGMNKQSDIAQALADYNGHLGAKGTGA